MAHRAALPLTAWSPTPVIRASLLAHAAALGALIVEPRLWLEILGVMGANHALLACGMRPRSAMLGANLTSLPTQQAEDSRSVAITFDDGPDPDVTPRLLDLLDAHGAKASFFVIGRQASRYPRIVRDIMARGHSVENHTYSHPHSFGCWTPSAMMREILQAQDAIANACGQSPIFFRAPAGIRNPLLDPVLAMCGLQLVTWTRRGYDTISPNPNRVYDRLTRGLKAGDILLQHDRHTRRGSSALIVTPLLLARLRRDNLTPISLRMTRQEGSCAAEAARATVPACP